MHRLPTARSVADRALPAILFGLLCFISAERLTQSWTDSSSDLYVLKIVQECLSIVYAAMIAALFVIRRAPVSQRASLSARATALAGAYIPWIIFAQPSTIDDWRILAFGNLLMIAGLLFTIYSLGTLGTCFSIAPEARGLKTTGPYQWVRNPAYLAEFVTVIGGMLSLLAPLTILIFAAFCLLQLRRISMEETVLSSTFPEYDDYRRCTPALVPWHLLRLRPLRAIRS
jgi:protein-S-isoprenylcysteine O-methyltransferase Ste14